MDIKKYKFEERPNFTCYVEIVNNDIPYAHIDIKTMTPQTLKDIREVFISLVDVCEQEGKDMLCFYGDKKTAKLAEAISPLDLLQKIDRNTYLGTWWI